jgi:2-hydroxycyclohexanecarboxyl-CoA dehydrogenase
MRGLDSKTAFVTGAGGGFGRAISVRLAEEGATIVVNDVDEERAAETVDAVEAVGGTATTAVADVSDFDSVQQTVDDGWEAHGPIDVLVNNAGWDRIEWFLEQDPEVWDRIIDINLKGQLNCARAVCERMVAEDVAGSVVAVSSDAARVGSSGEAVYAGTKGGIVSFTKTLARELARNDINCNVVAPGPADTPLTREMREETDLAETILGAMSDQIPLGRMTDPEDVASAVAYFASEDAAFVTGQVLSVSGGLTMSG